jgi:hypothetical protein
MNAPQPRPDPADVLALAELAEKQCEIHDLYIVIVDELALVAGQAVALARREDALRGRLGPSHRRFRAAAADLMVEYLHGRLEALRPYLPTVSRKSADMAREALLRAGTAGTDGSAAGAG